MQKEPLKIGSAATLAGVERILNSFFYSTSYRVIEGKVHNKNGAFDRAQITQKKGRYYITIN